MNLQRLSVVDYLLRDSIDCTGTETCIPIGCSEGFKLTNGCFKSDYCILYSFIHYFLL